MTNVPLIDSEQTDRRDRGAILLLVLAVSIVLSLVVLALANFVAADLRYSQVIDARSKTLSSAESGIEYSVDRLRLNQTLCATELAAVGDPVSLTGSDTSPAGTPLPDALNGTDTRITCERLDDIALDDFADVAGWAVVIASYGGPAPNDQIEVDMTGTATINGPVFLPDPSRTETDDDSRVAVVDGDLWYTDADCSASNVYLNTDLAALNLDVAPPSARGGICTTRNSGDTFSEPPVTLPLAPPAPPDDTDPDCRVYYPGRYDSVPDLTGATNVYFRSGDYLFDFDDSVDLDDSEWLITGANVWAGSPEPSVDLGPCNAAAAADAAGSFPDGGGLPGATFYFDHSSRVWVGNGGALEIFPRRHGNHIVSIQALSTSWTTTDSGYRSLLRTVQASGADLVVHGLVWAPRGRVHIDDSSAINQKLLGGVVVKVLWLLGVDPDFEIRPAQSVATARILLSSTSTLAGVSTTVEAVVEYRPDAADLDDRVAVNSSRVVD